MKKFQATYFKEKVFEAIYSKEKLLQTILEELTELYYLKFHHKVLLKNELKWKLQKNLYALQRKMVFHNTVFFSVSKSFFSFCKVLLKNTISLTLQKFFSLSSKFQIKTLAKLFIEKYLSPFHKFVLNMQIVSTLYKSFFLTSKGILNSHLGVFSTDKKIQVLNSISNRTAAISLMLSKFTGSLSPIMVFIKSTANASKISSLLNAVLDTTLNVELSLFVQKLLNLGSHKLGTRCALISFFMQKSISEKVFIKPVLAMKAVLQKSLSRITSFSLVKIYAQLTLLKHLSPAPTFTRFKPKIHFSLYKLNKIKIFDPSSLKAMDAITLSTLDGIMIE